MEVKYRTTFAEFIWFNFYQLPRVLGFQIAAAVTVLVVGYNVFCKWTELGYSVSEQIIGFIILLFEMLGGFVVLLLAIFVLLQLTSQHQRSQINQNCKLTVSESGVINESPVKRTEINWSGISKVSQTRNIILVYLSEQSAFLISKKSFLDASEAKSFFDYTFGLWKASRSVVSSK